MSAFYNELDAHAGQWLRNLSAADLIAPGAVDERDIRDVAPVELAGFAQCHFFAGIGVWSYALRRAGWPDDRPVWTGSCPCQPFSAAGRGGGFADERHLWPHWFHLIEQRRPATIFGEQVASKDGLSWLDLVRSDLEGAGYAVGVFDLCAAGFGAPHIRQRLFFVASRMADAGRAGREICGAARLHDPRQSGDDAARRGAHGGMADADEGERGRRSSDGRRIINGKDAGWSQDHSEPAGSGEVCQLVDALGARLEGHGRHGDDGRQPGRDGAHAAGSVAAAGAVGGMGNAQRIGPGRDAGTGSEAQGGTFLRPVGDGAGPSSEDGRPGPVNGFWGAADWIGCTDGKWRAIEPGSFPLVDGASFRVGSDGAYAGKSRAKMLRGYGNAIVADVAAEFVRAFLDGEEAA